MAISCPNTKLSKELNTLKVRDDSKKILRFYATDYEDEKKYTFIEGDSATWCSESQFTNIDLRKRIEPWLTSLFQSEHLALLVGSGLTTAIEREACGDSNNGMGAFTPKSRYKIQIEKKATESVQLTCRGNTPNIEDYIRVMNELLAGLKILDDAEAIEELSEEIDSVIKNFVANISNIENRIILANETTRTMAFNTLVLFLMSFASRTGTRDRLNIFFTTNYDRLIEAAADIAGIRLIDRFVGSLTPIFRSSRMDIDMHYNPPGIRGEPRYLEGVVHYTKLHGSIDWVQSNNEIRKIGLPFGALHIEPYLKAPGINASPSKTIIYPNASKDRETSEYPFVELFRDFAAALCRPNSTLVIYGYSFGDDHLNRIIRDMLTIPSTHLIIIAYGDSNERIMDFYKRVGRPAQISLLIGPDIGNISSLVNCFLPKPSIDRTTIRMADLLRQRYEQPHEPKKPQEGGDVNDNPTR